MQGPLKSILAGAVSGIATYFVSLRALGYTNAFVMPSWASLTAWEILVVLGLGATLVALVVHLIAVCILRAHAPWALASFFGTTLLAMALAGLLAFAKTLAAWLLGALLASLAYRKLRPNNAFKPKPLRGSA
ncbi:hypothetical protein [Luteimonas sp. MC1828]|uniref:hypothetical protein n=1 Tax=Luteimonas sp. MC1828 TaxID=2799787 RepID=UPI0018F18DBD|nr:hypothetical protein [Luteimonas sp. MC1828]MBJ7575494.1 hypothetical protein [Luteimonas sp. MC1828]